MRDAFTDLPAAAKATLIFGVLGFVISLEFWSTSSHNGVMTACSYVDYGALGLGAVGAISGVRAILIGLGRTPARLSSTVLRNAMVIGGIGLVLGVLHLIRGMGWIGGPCN